jgi:hypothetical protein
VIPRSGRAQKKKEGPGPADYNVKSGKQSGRQTIHAGRFEEVGNFMDIPSLWNPSPDAYQKLDGPGTRGKSIPRKGRNDDWRNPNPGPGQYNVTHGSFVKRSYNVEFPRNNSQMSGR